MKQWLTYFTQGIAVLGVLLGRLPQILYDGKVTVNEIAVLTEEVCRAAGWQLYFDVPGEIAQIVIGVHED